MVTEQRDGVVAWTARPAGEGLARDVLRLAALSAIAVAQPIFDLLGRNAEFFVARRSDTAEVLLLVVGLLLAAPLAAGVAEALAGVGGARARRIVHLVAVAVLVTLVALPLARRIYNGPTWLVGGGCVAIGIGVAAWYAGSAGLRVAVTLGALVVPLLAAWFLLRPDVRSVAFADDAGASAGTVRRPAPVVLVVFDELPTSSLLRRDLTIDAARVPNFAALARESTWYRKASSVYAETEGAVPVILTGRNPAAERLPIVADHPRNLFTMLGAQYRFNVSESVTRLCPPSRCRVADPGSRMHRLRTLVSDVSIAYLHVVAPRDLARRLPSVGQSWGGFAALEGPARGTPVEREALEGEVTKQERADFVADQVSRIPPYLDGIRGGGLSLNYLHILLPHRPWTFLPSGKRYTTRTAESSPPQGDWGTDPFLVEQGLQRHLLQTQHADRLLGQILTRLKEQRVYDDALVVVTADHGVAFVPGKPVRGVTLPTLPEIATVPLFVKLPGQRGGAVDDRNAQTVDVLPTIADALDAEVPWRFDGASLLGNDPLPPRKVFHRKEGHSLPVPADLPELPNQVARNYAVFGAAGDSYDVHAWGPYRGVVGRPARATRDPGLTAEIDGAELFDRIDPSAPVSRAHVTGRLRPGGGERRSGVDLAIAVNGVVRTTTRTYGDGRISAFLPESSLIAGTNRLEMFALSGDPTAPTVARVRLPAAVTYRLEEPAGQTRLVPSDGPAITVGGLKLSSGLDAVREAGGSLMLSGWVADVAGHRVADRVVLVASGRSIYVGAPADERRDVATRFRDQRLRLSGFHIEIERELVGPAGLAGLRLFAILGDRGTELPLRR